MLSHQHYSPFQFETATSMAVEHKKEVKEKKFVKSAHLEHKRLTHNLGCTMPVSTAHEVTSLPQAFISPNLPDVMRQAKAVFGEF